MVWLSLQPSPRQCQRQGHPQPTPTPEPIASLRNSPHFVYKLLVEGSMGHDQQAAPKFSEEDLRSLLAPLPGSALNPTAADRAASP